MSRSNRSRCRKSCSRKRNAAFWKAHVKAWQDSGLSRAEYCRRYKLSYDGLTYWYGKVREADSNSGVGAIVPVLSVQAPERRSRSPLRIRFRQHFTIEIDDEFDEAVLRRLIAALEV